MEIKKFKNGNFSVSKDCLDDSIRTIEDFVVGLCNSIDVDFEYSREECTNTESWHVLFNANTGKYYYVFREAFQNFMDGKKAKLYAWNN